MKLKEKMNNKYSVIAGYVIVTAIIIYCLGLIATNAPDIMKNILASLSWLFNVCKPVLLGFIFAYLVEPIVNFFEINLRKVKIFNRKLSSCRTYAVLITFVIVIIFVAAIISLLVYSVTDQLRLANLDDIITLSNAYMKTFNDFSSTVQSKLTDLNVESTELNEYIQNATKYVLTFLRGVADGAIRSVTNMSGYLTTFFFAVIIAIYFLIDGKMIGNYLKKVRKALLSNKLNDRIHDFLSDADKVFSGYIRGQLMDAFVMMVLISLALSIIGIKFGILIGVLAGIGNLIPYCGPFIAYAGTILIGLINGQYKQLIIALIALFIIQVIDGNIIGPRLLSKSIEVHPLLVIISLIFGSAVGGLSGMLLAVPVGAFIKVLFVKFIDRQLELKQEKEQVKERVKEHMKE
ncbi:putative PurR-regulated permease PerM [Mobilisporobacter senegalensis]|uniref:Putative PurR-regulated permease PerM n=1 Tax=Mobilisporobacter senegalensis TaxID=1329262 RepID=A0A3N1XQI9_9FIRM|nr:AI-2E family transporter [Mobilisporobacter senegalensis]ROR28431.1 putative PurR-regulated permease PerM [Mobilisporobacter senegalensis]